MPTKLADIEAVRDALEHFAGRAPGCPDSECHVCIENSRIKAAAERALERLEARAREEKSDD